MSGRWMTGDSTTAKLVEKQMRNWEIARSQRIESPATEDEGVAQFLAISRRPGAGGARLAGMLSETLGWPVFDKQILDAMAGDDTIRRQVYESMDERDVGWFEETLRVFMQGEFETNDYFRQLTHTVLSLARQGSAIFLGRGIDLILPPSRGLRVRLIASWERCAERYAKRHDMTVAEATEQIERHEQQIAEFIRHQFNRDHTDPTRHDLVVNMDRFTPEEALDIVVGVLRSRGGEPAA